ncbi:hypothetical protein DRO97_08115 [Archaeoglobales archaeon]|nr:MAG: hypothetical protein DRO97_08115 [Archaeoglobales archaeon]
MNKIRKKRSKKDDRNGGDLPSDAIKGGEGDIDREFVKAIVDNVRECDKKILDVLKMNKKVKISDVLNLSRKKLVEARLDVLSRMGIIEIENETVRLKNNIDEAKIYTLPVNCDLIDSKIKSPMIWVTYKIIQNFKPRTYDEISKKIEEILEIHFWFGRISAWVGKLRRLGLVKKVGGRTGYYTVDDTITVLTDDYDELYTKWIEMGGKEYRERTMNIWRRRRNGSR